MITSIRELVLYLSHVMKVENIIQATVSVCGQRSFMNGFDCIILIGIRKGYFYCFHLHVVGYLFLFRRIGILAGDGLTRRNSPLFVDNFIAVFFTICIYYLYHSVVSEYTT